MNFYQDFSISANQRKVKEKRKIFFTLFVGIANENTWRKFLRKTRNSFELKLLEILIFLKIKDLHGPPSLAIKRDKNKSKNWKKNKSKTKKIKKIFLFKRKPETTNQYTKFKIKNISWLITFNMTTSTEF